MRVDTCAGRCVGMRVGCAGRCVGMRVGMYVETRPDWYYFFLSFFSSLKEAQYRSILG